MRQVISPLTEPLHLTLLCLLLSIINPGATIESYLCGCSHVALQQPVQCFILLGTQAYLGRLACSALLILWHNAHHSQPENSDDRYREIAKDVRAARATVNDLTKRLVLSAAEEQQFASQLSSVCR